MSPIPERVSNALRLIRQPVPAEKKRILAERWADLDPRWREGLQGFGQQTTGCGATIGVFPSCDFDCKGCYLGADANSIRRLPHDQVLAQLDRLRDYLGPKGNVQITDGEVTLLPEQELLGILRHTRDIGLIPMVMSHGDTFRRRPELLPRLVSEGGLTEISIHVDSLQRGRRGRYGEARSEAELMPLRVELAEMVRRVRAQTGVRLRAATTLTITHDNLDEVPQVVKWTFTHRDAFGLISFQPLAQVGRTRDHLRGVTGDELWQRVGTALGPYGFDGRERPPFQLGHPDCTRIEPLMVHQRRGQAPRVSQIVRFDSPEDEALMREFFARGLGGLAFRDDPPLERVCRILGTLASAPRWFFGPARRWIGKRAAELDTGFGRLAWGALRGRERLDGFTVVSHHFMSPEEVASAAGQERLGACIFRVPVGEEMVPMCQVNAGGVRDAVYHRRPSPSLLPVLSTAPEPACEPAPNAL